MKNVQRVGCALAALASLGVAAAARTDDADPYREVHISYVNGSITSGLSNFTTAEDMLRDEAVRTCGDVAHVAAVDEVTFSISGCGVFDPAAVPCPYDPRFVDVACDTRITYFRCYPQVAASAKVKCAP